MNLWPKDEGIRRFVLPRRFGRVAADLLGVKGVRVYHDQAFLKEAGGGITPWHQDQHYWPMPISDDSEQTGTQSSHRRVQTQNPIHRAFVTRR
jgi:hypothetical protein